MTTYGYCAVCKKHNLLVPLHDDKGGPLVCLVCAGKWHAEHGRRRRAGRVVIRAINAYEAAGGKWRDIDKLKTSALYHSFGGFDGLDPLGYMADAINACGETADLTSELLDDVIRLTHPDCHPPERQELAKRVTQQLLALKPFVFPAPKPKPKPIVPPPPRNESLNTGAAGFKEALQKAATSYPCKECKSTIPYYYCTAQGRME
jgi:hypothetical protein